MKILLYAIYSGVGRTSGSWEYMKEEKVASSSVYLPGLQGKLSLSMWSNAQCRCDGLWPCLDLRAGGAPNGTTRPNNEHRSGLASNGVRTRPFPHWLMYLSSKDLIACGASHTVMISDDGKLWSFAPRMAREIWSPKYEIPCIIDQHMPVAIHAACGSWHSLCTSTSSDSAAIDRGYVYSGAQDTAGSLAEV